MRTSEGDRIRKRRGELELTLDGLAEKSGVDRKTIHQIEAGKLSAARAVKRSRKLNEH